MRIEDKIKDYNGKDVFIELRDNGILEITTGGKDDYQSIVIKIRPDDFRDLAKLLNFYADNI